MQPDLKKLITAFLGIALVSSAFGFAFVRSQGFQGVLTDAKKNNLSSQQRNAFADISLITPPWRNIRTASSSSAYLPSDNATENFAYLLAQQVAQAYHAPTTERTPQAISPTSVQDIVQKISSQAFKDSSPRDEEILVQKNATEEHVVAYLRSIREILKSQSQDKAYRNLFQGGLTVQKIEAVKNSFAQQENTVLALRTPEELIPLQRKMISFIRGYRTFFSSIEAYEADPIKALIAIQNTDRIARIYTQDLEEELTKVADGKIAFHFAPSQNNTQFSFKNLFTISTAHAQLAVPIDCTGFACIAGYAKDAAFYAKDLANWITSHLQTLLEWTQKLATEQLKNVLVQLFVRQTVAWVNGGGEPQFVVNWRDFAGEAYLRGTQKGFAEVEDEACSIFGSSMVRQLGNSFSTFYQPQNCAQGEWGQALDTFRNNSFYDGGWDAYGLAISPKGNYFQSYADFSSRITRSAETEKEAATNEGLANDGFKSTKICSDGSAPHPVDGCSDGLEPKTTTPGGVFKSTLDSAFTAPLDRIVNADNLVSLGLTLANGALSQVISQGINGITGLANGAGFSTSSEAQSYNLTDACAGFIEGTPGYTACIENAGSVDVLVNRVNEENASSAQSSNEDRAVETLKNNAQSIGQNRNTLASINTESLSLIEELNSELLNDVIDECGNYGLSSPEHQRVGEARQKKLELSTLASYISRDNTVDRDLMATDLLILSQTSNPVQIRDLFDRFQATYGTLASSSASLIPAQDRRVAIRQTKSEAQANISGACSTPFSEFDPDLLSN